MNQVPPEHRKAGKTDGLGIGGWAVIVGLGSVLAAAIAYAVHAWNAMAGVGMSTAGWIFMILGVVVTSLVGAGLMALIFYSSRRNYDL